MKFVFAFLALFCIVAGLHLEIPAESNPKPVCIRDFIQDQQLVVVSIASSGRIGDGQVLNFYIVDSLGNEYRRKNDIAGKNRVAFTSLHNAAVDICFTNTANKKFNNRGGNSYREIELDIESGAAARDWNALEASEKLKPSEVELRRIYEMSLEITQELQYLKGREERMRDTNESTNARVKWFSVIVIFALIGLGVWQISYLRHYFKVKHII